MYPHACAHWHQHTCNTHTHVHTHIIHTNTHTHPHTHICMHSTTYPIAVITHFITDMVDEAPVDVEHVDSTPRVKLHHFVLTAGHLLHFLCQHNQPSCLVNNRVNRKLSASAGQNWKNVCESLAWPVQMLWLKNKKDTICYFSNVRIKPGTHVAQCSCSTALFTFTSLQCATVDPEDNMHFLVPVSLHYDNEYEAWLTPNTRNIKCIISNALKLTVDRPPFSANSALDTQFLKLFP